MKPKNFTKDYIKAVNRQERNEEIALFGKPIFFEKKIKESNKSYSRKKKVRNIYDE